MHTSKFFHVLSSLLLLGLLAACSGAHDTPQATAAVVATLTPKPAIQLAPCKVGSHQALCGSMEVFEDQISHTGRKISLNIIVIKALSNHPASDPIFYFSGGPGGAATAEAKDDPIPSGLNINHDFVYVDQRGTGSSNRVLVPTDPPDLTGLSPAEVDAAAKAWVADFLASIDMDPRYYTSWMAMEDIDEVREALGYDKINLIGHSYGATAVQYYLRQHEEHVRTATLGVGSLLDIPVFQQEAVTSQLALDRILDLCLADPACQAAFPNIKEEFNGLMERLTTQPAISTFTDSVTKQPAPVTFTADYFGGLLRAFIKDARRDPSLPLFIHQAYVDNNWKGFTDYMSQGGGPEWWGDQLMERVIRCDEKWAAFDPTMVAQLAEGSFLQAYSTRLSQEQAASCSYTPDGITPEGTSPQPGSQVPVLIWNGYLDPLNPPENMAGSKELWPNSIQLVSPYQSHQISGMASICFSSITERFIQAGSADGLNTGCLQNLQPFTFNLR